MYRGKIPHKWNRDRYDPEFLYQAPHIKISEADYLPLEDNINFTEALPADTTLSMYPPLDNIPQSISATLTSAEKATLKDKLFSQTEPIAIEISPFAAEKIKFNEENSIAIEVSPPEAEIGLPEEAISLSEEAINLPEEDISLPEENISLPEEDISLPEEIINLPEEDISLPEENISLPEEDISLPEEIINPPEEDISLPEENRNLPEENINLPKETLNFPEEDLSLPEDEIKTVPQNLYDEKMGAEKLKAAIHENKTSDTLSAWQTQKLLSLSKENKLPHQNPGVAMAPNKLISGKNAVLEALRSGQTINRVLLAEEQSGTVVNEVIRRCRENGVPYQFLPKARLTKIAGPDHRGVVCELSSLSYAELEDVLQAAQESGEQPLILLLDGIEDPYNLGAIIRTALCAGAHGIVIPKRRAVSFTNAVAKSSAGASAYLPLVRVSNLSQTARILQQAGLWLAAADMSGNSAWQSDLRGPLALVLGGEGTGVSPLLKRQCDLCVSLPMSGPLGSLNVSAAAAALLYEIRRQRTTE